MTLLENDFTAIGKYLPLHRSLLPLAGPRSVSVKRIYWATSEHVCFVLLPGLSQALDTGVPFSLLPYDKEVGLMGKQRGSKGLLRGWGA